MREILFRGKRKDNGEWVKGNLVQCKSSNEYFIVEVVVCVKDSTNGDNYVYNSFPVIPETIGQYTGLTDKDGKKIFEGDIVNDHHDDNMPIKFGRHKIHCCGCCYTWHDAVGFYADDGDERISSYEEIWNEFKVIGNIHDNPELLEVATK